MHGHMNVKISEKYSNIRLLAVSSAGHKHEQIAIVNPEFSNNHIQDALRKRCGGEEEEFSPAEGNSGVHWVSV